MHWDASALAGTYFRSVTALRWLKTLVEILLPNAAQQPLLKIDEQVFDKSLNQQTLLG